MSLNKLKDALQDYQNSYSECLGITPSSSVPTQGRAETNSALPQPDFKIEIPQLKSLKKKSLLHRRKLRKTFLNKSTILSPNMVKMINHTQISRIKIFSVDLVLV